METTTQARPTDVWIQQRAANLARMTWLMRDLVNQKRPWRNARIATEFPPAYILEPETCDAIYAQALILWAGNRPHVASLGVPQEPGLRITEVAKRWQHGWLSYVRWQVRDIWAHTTPFGKVCVKLTAAVVVYIAAWVFVVAICSMGGK